MFEPYSSLSFGPFQLQLQMLALLVACIVSMLFLSERLKRFYPTEQETILNPFITSFIVAMIIYKIWPFLLEPTLLSSLKHIVFYSGGPYAMYAALSGAAFYFIYQWWKKKWSLAFIDELSLASLVGYLTFIIMIKQYGAISPFSFGWKVNELMTHPVNVYEAIVLASVFFFTITSVERKKTGGRTAVIVVLFLLTKVLLAPFYT